MKKVHHETHKIHERKLELPHVGCYKPVQTGLSGCVLAAFVALCSSLGGEMAEWFKAHAWKACVVKATVGSNPSLSATSSSVQWNQES